MNLSVDINEVLRYMGANTDDEFIVQTAKNAINALSKIIMPKYRYVKTPITVKEKGISLGTSDIILSGNDIKLHLANCSHCYLLCGTLGAAVDRHVKLLSAKNMLDAVAADAACADFIEKLMDIAENEIGKTEAENNCYITSRYSPGYGDLPISLQKELLSLCDAPRKIGLSVTESGILTPKKSVTAILGVSETPVRGKQKGCGNCNMIEKCPFRKAGKTCGS